MKRERPIDKLIKDFQRMRRLFIKASGYSKDESNAILLPFILDLIKQELER